MKFLIHFFVVLCVLDFYTEAEITDSVLSDLLRDISSALNGESTPDDSYTRQHQNLYRPQNNGISLGLYEALRAIARNDELECISRLLCEAAAGGKPGYSGKQIKFDKVSLTKLMSYLKLDSTSSSPLLVFGKAALLGVSNRGDTYSCIINYPKCPKDESRLLYYLNNHRGGFFQYFDNKYHKPGNYYYQNQYRPGYYYQNYQNYQKKFKRNKIQFESPNGLYDKLKKASSDVYAKKYTHSPLVFPESSRKKTMVFPNERSYSSGVDSRILTKLIRSLSEEKGFVFSNTNRFPKKLNDLGFFPDKYQSAIKPANYVTDRLPSRFYFPKEDEETYESHPNKFSSNSFFPLN